MTAAARLLPLLVAVLAVDVPAALAGTGEKTPIELPRGGGEGGGSSGVDSGGSGFLRLFFGMLVIVGVILAVRWLLKTYAKTKFPGFAAAAGSIEVIATKPLAPNRALHVVRVGEEALLVGSTEHSITALRTIPPEEAGRLFPRDGDSSFGATLDSALAAPGAPRRESRTQWGGFSELIGRVRERTIRG